MPCICHTGTNLQRIFFKNLRVILSVISLHVRTLDEVTRDLSVMLVGHQVPHVANRLGHKRKIVDCVARESTTRPFTDHNCVDNSAANTTSMSF